MSDPVASVAENQPVGGERPTSLPSSVFLTRLLIGTLSLLLIFMVIRLLQEFSSFLQPLFVAVFIGYMILPIHQWLVGKGIPSLIAYVMILVLILGGLFGLGTVLYHTTKQAIDRWDRDYKYQIEDRFRVLEAWLPEEFNLKQELHGLFDQSNQAVNAMRAGLGTALNFFTGLAVTFIYLVFLVAEKVSFPRRMTLAFGSQQGAKILEVTAHINQAIAQYISVKTFVSLLTGVLTTIVLALFRLDFYLTWGIFTFLFNYIPYLGSWVALALPIGLALLQLGLWQAAVIAVLLIAIQQVIGVYIEPRMTGARLGVSPLLILLSLSFWGSVWGITGMILAVPLLVTVKIILDNIRETKPLATLMSNL